jgi:hypothetical protein
MNVKNERDGAVFQHSNWMSSDKGLMIFLLLFCVWVGFKTDERTRLMSPFLDRTSSVNK